MSNQIAEEIPKVSSEEIADEIRKEALEKHIPYYAAMIERYADEIAEAHTKQRLTTLKEAVKGLECNVNKDWHDGYDGALEDVLTLIEEELQ